MPSTSTASCVTKNCIKASYHEGLKGFADWYFNAFPNEDGIEANDERLSLFFANNAPKRYFVMVDKQKFVQHMEDIDIDNNILCSSIFYGKERIIIGHKVCLEKVILMQYEVVYYYV